MIQTIKIKPLSVNEAWKGQRFRTDKYKSYQKELSFMLKRTPIPEGKLLLRATFGLSSPNSDWDNPIKPFQDILSKKFGFNDRIIYRGEIEKVDVKKGEEFISFELLELKK